MKRSEKIGSFLKQARIDAGWTQTEASKLLGYTSPQYISNFERGLCMPSLTAAVKLCSKYGVSRNELHKVYVKTYEDETKMLIFGKKSA